MTEIIKKIKEIISKKKEDNLKKKIDKQIKELLNHYYNYVEGVRYYFCQALNRYVDAIPIIKEEKEANRYLELANRELEASKKLLEMIKLLIEVRNMIK